VAGHIGYYGAGAVPIRKTGDGSLPYDGATDNGDWIGFIPFAQLPHLYDPPSGLIVTANQRVVGNSYRWRLTREWSKPYRARRIYDLLAAKPKLTGNDCLEIQSDTYTYPDVVFTREVARIARPLAAASDEWRSMLAAFADWDGKSSADSRVLPLAFEMRAAFRNRILTAGIGPARAKSFRWANGDTLIDQLVETRPSDWLPPEFTSYGELLLACYRDARESLKRDLGEDESQWVWGRMDETRFRHPLAGAPLVGAQFSIPPFPANTGGSGGFTVNAGAFVSMRLIADLSDWDRTRQGIALGQSGDPTSPHWKDQLEEWRAVAPRAFPFTQRAVEKSARIAFVMEPLHR
jgi:penicillin amidase